VLIDEPMLETAAAVLDDRSDLEPGALLRPYRVDSPLGRGGMGQVYRATDTRLNRTVALKVLPREVANDPQFRARLDREAHAIAALTHPHICTLHDIGHQAGVDFLVMEYLEGETLASRLEKGPIPVDHALTFASEMAEALAAGAPRGNRPSRPETEQHHPGQDRRKAARLRPGQALCIADRYWRFAHRSSPVCGLPKVRKSRDELRTGSS
jgi:serine/threonine protein kinase